MKSKKYPYLLEQKGKYETDKYLIQSEEDLFKASLAILKDYRNCGYLYLDKETDKTFEEYVKEQVGLSVAEIEEMTQGKTAKLKIQFTKYGEPNIPVEQIKLLKQEYNSDQSHNNTIKAALKALKDQDGKVANSVLNYFSGKDYEYMTIRIHYFCNVK